VQLFVYTQADDDRRLLWTCKFVIQTVVAGGGTLLIKQQSFRYDVPGKENDINNIVMTTVKIFLKKTTCLYDIILQ